MSRLLCDCVHDDYFVASFAAAHVGSGVPNLAKDGIAPLEGVVETDWLSFTFTMNWIFTRPGRVRFEADEPFCFITPVNYRAIEAFEPEVVPIAANPELAAAYMDYREQRSSARLSTWAGSLRQRTPNT